MNAKEKNRLAGILLLAHGGITALIYLLMVGFFGLVFSSDPNMPGVLFLVMSVAMSVSFAIFVLPQLLAGWKMYKEDPNARNWGIVGAILACISGFLGIGAGVFALIFLFGDDGKRFYDSLAGKTFLNPANPADDLSFQNYQQQQQPREPHSWR